MTGELERRWQIERWIAWVRLFPVPFAVFEVGVIVRSDPGSVATFTIRLPVGQ
jgi:hypothetical protein